MEVKAFAATVGLSMVAGVTVAMMLPKKSPVRKAADQAAKKIQREVRKVTSAMM